jgi:dTDP-4-dehydrorhamnose reductase
MKILIIGANGMAGHVITKYLKNQGNTVVTVARNNADYSVDIENTELVKLFFSNIEQDFDFVINCVGLLVKDSVDRPDRAAIINSWFPHYLEYTYKNTYTKVIHLSTDCVFDGGKGNYIEDDTHTEMNSYGSSKSLGEINNSKDITFRMSIIGPEIKSNGTGLLNWVVTSSEQKLQGWENAWWNAITTLQLAKCINLYINTPIISGIYHLVSNENKINKYNLLQKINTIYSLKKDIVRTVGPKSINKILVDTRQEFDFQISNYDTMLTEMRDF